MTETEIEKFNGQVVTVWHRYRLASNGVAKDTGSLDFLGSRVVLELPTEEIVMISPEKVIDIKAGRH